MLISQSNSQVTFLFLLSKYFGRNIGLTLMAKSKSEYVNKHLTEITIKVQLLGLPYCNFRINREKSSKKVVG